MKYVILITALFSALASAQESSRWTLTDYLSQKQKIRLMDRWLALNTAASKFEGILSGGTASYDVTATDGSGVKVKTKENVTSAKLSIFYTIFGLEGEYEKSNKDWNAITGMGSLRLLGGAQQDTNLTVSYGVRKKELTADPKETFQNQFAQGALTLYILPNIGIDGSYRHYFNNKSSASRGFTGSVVTGGLFFEIGLIRIFGQYVQEKSEIKPADGSAGIKEEKTGMNFGAKIFL